MQQGTDKRCLITLQWSVLGPRSGSLLVLWSIFVETTLSWFDVWRSCSSDWFALAFPYASMVILCVCVCVLCIQKTGYTRDSWQLFACTVVNEENRVQISSLQLLHLVVLPSEKLNFIDIPLIGKSRDSSVGIALGYGLDRRGSRVRFPAGSGNFSLHHHVRNGSGAHPVFYAVGTRGCFPGCRAAGAWSWPLTSIYCRGQRMRGAISLLPQYVFMAWCSITKKHKDNFLSYIYLYKV
jgi:hypothetical protein